jgi:outer membrane protein assembly factor BamD (BamD/ComL family)
MNLLPKILTALALTISVFQTTLADSFNQETFKTHLRWNIVAPRDQVFITKKDQTLVIETLNLQLFEKLAHDFGRINADQIYVTDIKYSQENFPTKPASITVSLKDQSIELFSFYRDVDRKYILDFWINKDLVTERTAALSKPLPLPEVKKVPVRKAVIAQEKKVLPPRIESKILPIVEVDKTITQDISKNNPDYRDFRYGASFVWDYLPMIPTLEKDVNLASKTPDSLFPIKDREFLSDEKEAHLQLSINFYRKDKFGLMNKSIDLYNKKYGTDKNSVWNDYLKANALLRGNIAKPNKGITQSALNILSNIVGKTDNYELKSAIYRYSLQYSLDNTDYVKALQTAKEFFVEARSDFDQDYVIYSAQAILYSLSQLKQVDKIEEFLSDKKLMSILPAQIGLAYSSYALLAKNQSGPLVKKYQQVAKSLTKPVHPAILYNIAEALFREAEFEQALKLFDEFAADYSYTLNAPYARVRMALIYEILDRPVDQTLTLYRKAIDRSTLAEPRYEAKVRYVAMRTGRKLKPDDLDKESVIFLEQSPDETKILDANLKKILWITRLRSFVNAKEYDKALSYLTTIPLDALKPAERRVFEGDGAEIVFGLIQKSYLEEQYAKAVKIWEVYKDKYESKVAKAPYMNFVICESFLKLGLYKSFDRAYESFKTVKNEEERLFPQWVDRVKSTKLADMVEELNLIRLVASKDWDKAGILLASFPVSLRDSINYSYYSGVINYHQKKYNNAIGDFEKVLIKQNPNNQLTPRQTADLLMSYVESLYQLKDESRFKSVVRALAQDIDKSKSAPILNVAERVQYLLIETLAGDEKPNYSELSAMTKSFKEKFQKSPYTPRISYIYGLSLVKSQRVKEGKEVLTSLMNDSSAPAHIKEMCRSELTSIELSNRNL